MMNKVVWHNKLYLALFYIFTRTTPRFWQVWQNRLISPIIFYVWAGLRRTVQQNVAGLLNRHPSDPLVRRTACRTVVNYGLYLIDYTQLNRLRRHMIPEQRGAEHMRAALDEGNGVILITPHLGNWELGGVVFAMRGHPIYALTLMDSQENVQAFRDNMRSHMGIHTVHIDPENTGTILKLATLLRRNQVIAMLGDRCEGGKKVPVSFFGKTVMYPAGASALALATGAPIIPAFTVLRADGSYLAWMDPPIRVKRVAGQPTIALLTEKTQEIAGAFEKAVSRYPDQWYHFFDYWERYGC